MTNDPIDQPELRWTDDNPFCDLPHGFEFHLDYFDRFVLQTFRREDQGRFSSFVLMYWLELGRQPRREDDEEDGSEDSPGLPPTTHHLPPTSP